MITCVAYWNKILSVFLFYRYKKPTKSVHLVDRIKLLSMKVLKENKEKFGTDFDKNKNILNDISIITSKPLRNRLAGYITRMIKNELIESEKAKKIQSQEETEEQNETVDDKAVDDKAVDDKAVDDKSAESVSKETVVSDAS